ncbi:MAG: CBS domain-containing protein [Anaerolineales bacterium]|nr:CBS domain-containing protein [Anaerolineales bacterium]
MATVGQLLMTKGSDVWAVGPDDTVFAALQLMADKNIGAVMVLEGDRVVGIMSERDYARKVILQQRASRSTPVREIMTADVVFVRPELSLEKCLALMTDKRIRHLPVLHTDSELAGIVSIGDVVKAVIEQQKVLINHLEDYISGGVY